MNAVVDDVQADYPNEDAALHVAEALGDIFERNLLRDHVVPRIADHAELDWLKANHVNFAIKSSVNQFVEGHYLRIQVLNKANQQAWRKWREQ
ncbi:hypothetical protein ASE79_14655 [Sphingomonas sp. Leaf28]|nr:hypothetical protein ASE79_14655 [Sphingomonas sp. Leaf28]